MMNSKFKAIFQTPSMSLSRGRFPSPFRGDKDKQRDKEDKTLEKTDSPSQETLSSASFAEPQVMGGTPDTKKENRRSKGKNRRKDQCSTRPSVPAVHHVLDEEQQTPNEQVVAAHLDACNRHTINQSLYSNDLLVNSEDVTQKTGGGFLLELENLFKSFPDIRFRYDGIKEETSGTVVVEELVVCGTHRGDPYGCDSLSPIPPTNRHVVNDPERLWFTIDNGQITAIQIVPLGDRTGAHGLYEGVGGKLSPKNENTPPRRASLLPTPDQTQTPRSRPAAA